MKKKTKKEKFSYELPKSHAIVEVYREIIFLEETNMKKAEA